MELMSEFRKIERMETQRLNKTIASPIKPKEKYHKKEEFLKSRRGFKSSECWTIEQFQCKPCASTHLCHCTTVESRVSNIMCVHLFLKACPRGIHEWQSMKNLSFQNITFWARKFKVTTKSHFWRENSNSWLQTFFLAQKYKVFKN